MSEPDHEKKQGLWWEAAGFKIESTGDGSPTLRLVNASSADFKDGESMHHSGGAAAETIHIYQPVVDKIFSNSVPSPAFLSVGLGLGYNEILWAYNHLLHQREGTLVSYEKVPALREEFLLWVHADSPKAPYDQIVRSLMDQLGISSDQQLFWKRRICEFLKKMYHDKKWIVREELNLETLGLFAEKFHGIFYDAFSSKTNSDLWDKGFLGHLLKNHTAYFCCLSTYACTGVLKRALKEENFTVEVRIGFQGKRNHTFAFRTSL